MKKFVRVQDGKVVEVVEAAELPPFTPDIAAQFREVPKASPVDQRWEVKAGTFQPPPAEKEMPPSPDEMVEALIRKEEGDPAPLQAVLARRKG